MSTYKLGYKASTKTAYIAFSPDALPGDATDLGTFSHDSTHNDVLFHHVRDALYKRSAANPATTAGFPKNINDAGSVKIVRTGASMLAEYLSAAAISVAKDATATLVLKYQPGTVAATNSHFTFVSADATIATVSSAGLITGIKAGSTEVTATHKESGMKLKVKITVT